MVVLDGGGIAADRQDAIRFVAHVEALVASVADAQSAQEIGVGRALDGQEGADGIERFREEFVGSDVIATDEATQSLFYKFKMILPDGFEKK